jgi:hypothetical protein
MTEEYCEWVRMNVVEDRTKSTLPARLYERTLGHTST